MRTKEQMIELLKNDPLYSSVMSELGEKERETIAEMVEPFFTSMLSMVENLKETVDNDPNAMKELLDGLNGKVDVINDKSSKK